MISRIGLLAIVCLVVSCSGCVTPARVNTVPWWKGLPCMVIAPSSIEAHVWREHLHGGDCCDETPSFESCPCESMVDSPLEEFAPDGDVVELLPDPEIASPPMEPGE